MEFANGITSRREFLKGTSRATILAGGLLSLPACPIRAERIVIVGSGITGLCAGALFAKQGHHVHVLEAHPEWIGGNAATMERDGFQFSLGPQYVWGFRDGGIGERVLSYLGLNERVPFDSLNADGFEEYRIGDTLAAGIPMGLDRYEQLACEIFGNDCEPLRLFFSYIGDIFEAARVIDRLGLYRMGAGSMMSAVAVADEVSNRAKIRCTQCALWSLAQLFDHCGLSADAQRFLYGNSGLFLESASSVWCFAYAAAIGYYHTGADYPRFGFRSLIEGLADCITENGGSVEVGRRVTALPRIRDRIVEVQCADGDGIPADRVISTLSPRLSHALLGPSFVWRANYTPSASAISAFIGLRDYPEISERLAGRVLWWQDGEGEADFALPEMRQPPRVLSVASDSGKGIYNPNSVSGDHSIEVFAPGNFNQATEAYLRDIAEHDDLRDEIAERLLQRVEEHVLPGLRPYIRFMDVQTPHDLWTRTGSELGSIYGRRLTSESLLNRPYDLLGVPNFHVACATAGMPGIPIAFRSAALLVQSLTGLTL